MARPSKISREIIEKIAESVLHGSSYEAAAAAAGIHYDTLNEWMKKGREQKSGIYREFSEALETANGQCTVNMVRIIQSAAAKGDWKAALEWLKRRRRGEWGDSVALTDNEGNKFELIVKYADSNDKPTKPTSETN